MEYHSAHLDLVFDVLADLKKKYIILALYLLVFSIVSFFMYMILLCAYVMVVFYDFVEIEIKT